jgi:hypothetical protein
LTPNWISDHTPAMARTPEVAHDLSNAASNFKTNKTDLEID